MLVSEMEMLSLVRELEENGVADRSHVPVGEVRALLARAIRITHHLLHPNCDQDIGNDTLRFALLDLDRGSPRPRVAI